MMVDNPNLTSTFQVPLPLKKDNLEDMFQRMEIKVVGRQNEEVESEKSAEEGDEEEGSDGDLEVNQSFMEDNRISQKHQKYTDLEGRAREDMDFPDEVDTPLDVEARKRFI